MIVKNYHLKSSRLMRLFLFMVQCAPNTGLLEDPKHFKKIGYVHQHVHQRELLKNDNATG